MNFFDSGLKFTETEMSENKLIFLDTKVVIVDDKLELEQYRKTSTHTTSMMNYKQAIAPRQYKNSCLSGEIYRAFNCTSNEANLESALENLEEIFLNNQYPKNLIKSKIAEIKDREFGPNPNKLLREADENNPDLKFFYMSLNYTSFRCSQIATKIKNIIEKYTPNYRLKICFKTITLEKVILPRLKPYKPLLLTPNTVYLFTCTCSATYIGHTSRILKVRIQEHGRCEESHIYDHIFSCVDYHNSLENRYRSDPNRTELRSHLYEHFTALSASIPNWYERTAFEGLMITQMNPTLNVQLKFRKSNLICTCITRVNDLFEKIE